MKYFLPLLVIACSAIGSLANIFINSDTWYVDLVKSPLNPPSFVFGIVWPILYALMAFVSFKSADKIWKLFIPQLILNAAWSWMFFFMHAPLLALINISILIFLNQKILVILKIESKLLFWLYLPYVLWLTFAAFLNASIVLLN
ncbi:tryptophan-rich sensory protein [Gammaproteobacteria bacterium]|jgi:benzodiazapine receptor|nr:tryptophan-rich sensory protein [Gammaproteobacteria bacterium]MDA9763011.1 tryptophan-rich sensory protein [Gammaproteobacteria bacterium]MDA9868718.1 tryptophan-rich sensory protein [Gammaproteobacteria bacterium]MDB9738019.1 tryptophan-rich sensory protein [Gammaproteobacteria bacterium]MDB9885342.1 tryptophan-rich sensory protein [Gammaproteobacteria bacterium]